MTLSAIHNRPSQGEQRTSVVCDIGGYDFVSYSQPSENGEFAWPVVCDIGGYDFVSYSQRIRSRLPDNLRLFVI